MQIHRYNSRLSYRRRRRRGGCMPFIVMIGVLLGVGALSWNWLTGTLTTALQPAPASSDRLASARAAFNRGDLDATVTLAREALLSETRVTPAYVETINLLARALVYRSYADYNRAADRQSAVELTGEALSKSPGNTDLLAIHAFTLGAVQNVAAAAETAERALEKSPNHPLARTALALAYGGAGSYEIALRESQRAVEAEPTLDALRALAIAQSDMGRYTDALATVGRAITAHPRLTPLYFERALYALQISDVDAATEAYFYVLTLDENNVKVRLRLCELSSTMRERESAIRYCSEVTRLAPAWADGWYRLGREYFLQGNFEAAQSHLNQCSRLQVLQDVPVTERRFECWYLQGQAAEIREMAADSTVRQTWTYPPEGPPGCAPTP
jgi:tetratricopeptide (TPR) repeat protein